jgi:hypothetical protein
VGYLIYYKSEDNLDIGTEPVNFVEDVTYFTSILSVVPDIICPDVEQNDVCRMGCKPIINIGQYIIAVEVSGSMPAVTALVISVGKVTVVLASDEVNIVAVIGKVQVQGFAIAISAR